VLAQRLEGFAFVWQLVSCDHEVGEEAGVGGTHGVGEEADMGGGGQQIALLR
jgi:hypothetical protein